MFWQWIFSGGDKKEKRNRNVQISSGMKANTEENPYFKHNKPTRKGSKIVHIYKFY